MKNFFKNILKKSTPENIYIMVIKIKDQDNIKAKIDAKTYIELSMEIFSKIKKPLRRSNGKTYKSEGEDFIFYWQDNISIDQICAFIIGSISRLESSSEYFVNKFGFSPVIRAGLHYCKYLQNGTSKINSTSASHNDPANITSKIAEICGEKNCRFLLSETAIRNYEGKYFFQKYGIIQLEESKEGIPLYSIE